MQKLALVLLVGSVLIGALMPAQPVLPPETESVAAPAPEERQTIEFVEDQVGLDLGTGAVTIPRSADGHFYAEAQVNGEPVNFLIDTGATSIALTRDDARRAALFLTDNYQVVGSGASGEVMGQFVELDRVALGLKEARRIDAVVLEGGTQSLLGQSFLSKFASVSIEDDTMVLR